MIDGPKKKGWRSGYACTAENCDLGLLSVGGNPKSKSNVEGVSPGPPRGKNEIMKRKRN